MFYGSDCGTLGAMIRNVIFDWSGTLVDDLPAVWEATNFVFRQAGRAELTLEQFRAEFCLPFMRFYERHVPLVPMPQLEAWFHATFQQTQASVIELPHAREFLQFCRRRGLRTFTLTSVRQDHFERQAKALGFAEYIDHPYLGIRDKCAAIHDVLTEHQLDPRETLLVGDMQHDIDAAKEGGIFSCAVLTGYNSLTQLRASAPDLIVEHLGELRELLEKNGLEFAPGAGEHARKPVVTVGALIFDAEGRVLMVRTPKWSGLWGIPGGKTKYGESSLEALRREIREETNLEIEDIRFVLVQDCIHSREFYREAHFVLLNYTCRCMGEPEVRLNDEAVDFRWVTRPQAWELALNQPTRILLEAVFRDKPPRPDPAGLTP